MSPEPFQKPPYLDWSLDRWKTGTILLIFGGLVISWLAGPAADPATADAQGRMAAAATASPTLRALAGVNDAPPAVTATPAATPTATAESRGETVPPASPSPPALADTAAVTDTLPATPTTASVLHLFPLTLANVSPNAIVPAQSIRVLYGTAAAGSLVEVR